jgi:hypothetical protein
MIRRWYTLVALSRTILMDTRVVWNRRVLWYDQLELTQFQQPSTLKELTVFLTISTMNSFPIIEYTKSDNIATHICVPQLTISPNPATIRLAEIAILAPLPARVKHN